MQHYSHLDESTREAIFASPPRSFSARDDAQHVGSGLGASLYMPGTRPQLADDVVTHHARGLVSTVWCLEDSISESEVPAAQANIVTHLAALAARFPTPDDVAAALPLIFVRVRTPQQLRDLATLVNEGPGGESTWSSAVLAGFVMPKFTGANAPAYFDALAEASALAG
ncbi:HpcH/HpaI aldolase/citrate lyase family protein, partial [Dermacoccus sp. UBA1591]